MIIRYYSNIMPFNTLYSFIVLCFTIIFLIKGELYGDDEENLIKLFVKYSRFSPVLKLWMIKNRSLNATFYF